MSKPEFDVTIGKDGKVHVHIKGAKGTQCMELADFLRDVMGKEDSRQKTAEFYEQDTSVRMNVQAKTRRQND